VLSTSDTDPGQRDHFTLTGPLGGPVAKPAWHSIAWSIAITVIFAPLAARRYRGIG
jgi:hypothetical protein